MIDGRTTQLLTRDGQLLVLLLKLLLVLAIGGDCYCDPGGRTVLARRTQ